MLSNMLRVAPRASSVFKTAPALRSMSMAVPRSALMPKPASGIVSRSLHSTRKTLADSTLDAYNKQAGAYAKLVQPNMHVLEAPSVTTWQEIPKGGLYAGLSTKEIIWKIWYNHAVVP